MADYDYNTRRKITELRDSKLDARTGKLKGDEKKLAEEIKSQNPDTGSYTHLDVDKRQIRPLCASTMV